MWLWSPCFDSNGLGRAVDYGKRMLCTDMEIPHILNSESRVYTDEVVLTLKLTVHGLSVPLAISPFPAMRCVIVA